MNITINKVKIFVMVPKENVDELRNSVCKAGAGIIGNYSYCTSTSKVTGTFKPNDEANPYIGSSNLLEFVSEEKLEFICSIDIVNKIISIIREVHPYEEPEIDIVPLIDEDYF